jgi:hypothetical protein
MKNADRHDFYAWLTQMCATAIEQKARITKVRVSRHGLQYLHPIRPDQDGRYWLVDGRYFGARVELESHPKGWNPNRPAPAKRRPRP